MSRRGIPAAALAALALLAPARASAENFAMAVTMGESYRYLSPWDVGDPTTTFGLQFASLDSDLDILVGAAIGRNWGGSLDSAGTASFDFRLRLHGDYNDYDILFGYFLWGASYRHLWAKGAPEMAGPPAVPATWTTRSEFDVTLGGGYVLLADDNFYFDFLVHVDAGLMWPEADWAAGGGVDLALGFYSL